MLLKSLLLIIFQLLRLGQNARRLFFNFRVSAGPPADFFPAFGSLAARSSGGGGTVPGTALAACGLATTPGPAGWRPDGQRPSSARGPMAPWLKGPPYGPTAAHVPKSVQRADMPLGASLIASSMAAHGNASMILQEHTRQTPYEKRPKPYRKAGMAGAARKARRAGRRAGRAETLGLFGCGGVIILMSLII